MPRQRARGGGRSSAAEPVDYLPACVEACPTGAIQFRRPERPPVLAARAKPAGVSACWRNSAPIPRFTTSRTALGEDNCQRPAPGSAPESRGRKGESSWIEQFIARGVKRCSTGRFLLVDRAVGGAAGFRRLCRRPVPMKGLNQTNMDNRFAFGLWIFLDLTVIALGAGAFFTGFLLYILKVRRTERGDQQRGGDRAGLL